MASHGEFDYASSGLLDDSYIPVARKSEPGPPWRLPNRDVSPPTDDEGKSSPRLQSAPLRSSRIFREQQERISSQVVAHREKVSSAKVSQQRAATSPTERPQPLPSRRDVSPPDSILSPKIVKAPAPSRLIPSTSRVVLAIDYGTTYTGGHQSASVSRANHDH